MMSLLPLSHAETDSPGRLVRHELVGQYSPKTLDGMAQAAVKTLMPWVARYCPVDLGPAQNAVSLYRVIYRTRHLDGRLISVSGLVVVPGDLSLRYPLLSYQHGTSVLRSHVPSNPEESPEAQILTPFFGGQGYVVSMADYIGMGRSRLDHPYNHCDSEASTCLDMLRATRELCRILDVRLGSKLFLLGYSQGALATMALHRLIEEHHPKEFRVTASAPSGAPLDQQICWASWLDNPNYFTNVILAYTIVSYNRIYRIWDSYEEVFLPPYHKTVPGLFDGNHSDDEIAAGLPARPDQLLQKAFIDKFRSGDHIFYAALRANSSFAWSPKAPVRILQGKHDDMTPFEGAQTSASFMRALGADIKIVNVCGYRSSSDKLSSHVEIVIPTLSAALEWFDSILRKQAGSDLSDQPN